MYRIYNQISNDWILGMGYIQAFINNKSMEKLKNISYRLDRVLKQAAKRDSQLPVQIQNGIKASYGLSFGAILGSFILQVLLFNDLRKNNFDLVKAKRFKRPLYGCFGMLIAFNMGLFYFCKKAEQYMPEEVLIQDLSSASKQPDHPSSYSFSNANQKI